MYRRICKVIAFIFSALTAACVTSGTTRRDVLSERSAASSESIHRQQEVFDIFVYSSPEARQAMEENGAILVGITLHLTSSGEKIHLDSKINGVFTLRVFIDAPVVKGERVLRITSVNSDRSTDIAIIKGSKVVEMTSYSQK